MRSKVTTGQGDQGTTLALSGERYPKSHIVIETGGSLDELRVQTAMLRLELQEAGRADCRETVDLLFWLLHAYFLVGAECSDPTTRHPEFHIRKLTPKDVDKLQKAQQDLEKQSGVDQSFTVSAANLPAARADLVCVAARRFERDAVRLREAIPEFGYDELFTFVNRLSDYFYVLARWLDGPDHLIADYTVLDED